MALLGREFIAVPDDKKGQLVYKWPDQSIRRYTRAIVNADELAIFVNTGKVAATMGPGRYQIDADEIPGLGIIVDAATGRRAYRAELYFVANREFTGFTFGGRIDDVQDPQTGLIVTLRVFGDYALRVVDPLMLIMNLLGTLDVTDNGKVSNWVSDQMLKVLRTDITTQIVRNSWPILGLSAYTPEIEQKVIENANRQIETYGVAITRMGNFDINLAEEDQRQLKTLAKDTSYSRLAGSFNQYAAGEMALGAGQGMAQGGAGVGGAFLGLGVGMGQQGAQPYQPAPPPPQGFAGGGAGGYAGPPPAGAATGGPPAAGVAPAQGAPPAAPSAGVACPACHVENPAGAKFCQDCGTALAPRIAHCTNCGNELTPNAKFCPGCGTPTAATTTG